MSKMEESTYGRNKVLVEEHTGKPGVSRTQQGQLHCSVVSDYLGTPCLLPHGPFEAGVMAAMAQCWRNCEEIPYVQGQRSPRKMVGGAKSILASNPIPARGTQRAQTNVMHTRTQRAHRDWSSPVAEGLLCRSRSAEDWCRGGPLGAADLGVA